MPDFGDYIVVPNKKPAQVVIPDGELLLPDDLLPPARTYVVYSQWIGGNYTSLAQIIEKRKMVEAKFDLDMADWQRAIVAPCWVQYGIRDPQSDERLLVYGEITDLEEFIKDEMAGRIGRAAEKFARRLRRRMTHAGERGWLYGRWYSRTLPQGEYGAIHRAVIQRVLTEAEFLELKAKGWSDG